MVLAATGLVLFLLLLATYSRRATWLALGSAALSIALVLGFVFLSAGQNPNLVRNGLTRLAQDLPAEWDRYALGLADTIERASAALAEARRRVAAQEPIFAASLADWLKPSPNTEVKTETKTEFEAGVEAEAEAAVEADAEPVVEAKADTEPVGEAKAAAEPVVEAKADPEPHAVTAPADTQADAPVQWLLDEPPPAASDGFVLTGANISDQPLTAVRALLKPDSGAPDLPLALEGNADEAKAVIPPGARFRLEAEGLRADEAKTLGGAILSFAYMQAGQRKTSIIYLTPPTIAALAARD